MADKFVDIDGDTSLKAQEDSLNQAQNTFTAEVTAYDKTGTGIANRATLTPVAIGAPVRKVRLIVSPVPTPGKNPTFEGRVFVGGIENKVAGFH